MYAFGRSLVLALLLLLSSALSGCNNNSTLDATSPSASAPLLNPGDTNLIFVVSQDLANNAGDLNLATANLNSRGLQRAIKQAVYLHTTLLNSADVDGIYALEPGTHLQTPKKLPDMVPLETIEQFALLNQYTENVTRPSPAQNIPGASFPIGTSYNSLASVPPNTLIPQAFPANCQGLDFADTGGVNEALVNGILAQRRGGFYVFALPFETLQGLLTKLKQLNTYGYLVPSTWQGPNLIYVLAVPPSGAPTLTTFDTQVVPGETYPILSPTYQVSPPNAYQTPFTIQTATQTNSSVPANINTNQTIYFVRHGEAHPTPAWDDGNLLMAGNWRALYLPTALAGKITLPDFVYAPDPANLIPGPPPTGNPGIGNYSYIRPSQTVAPYAIANAIPFYVTTGFSPATALGNETIAAASFFFLGGQFSNKTLLVGWEHNNIPWIAQSLVNFYFGNVSTATVPPVPPNTSWPDTDYDTIWTFTLDGGGNLTISNRTCEGINSTALPSTPPNF